MKSLFILALAFSSATASAALREPGTYTGECHGISVMAEYQNGKELQRFPSKFRYDVEITVAGEGKTRIETTTTTLHGEHGPHGVKNTSQTRVEEVSANLIRRTHLGLGRSCDYQVDGGGTENWLSCTNKDGTPAPAQGKSYATSAGEAWNTPLRSTTSAPPRRKAKISAAGHSRILIFTARAARPSRPYGCGAVKRPD